MIYKEFIRRILNYFILFCRLFFDLNIFNLKGFYGDFIVNLCDII